MSGSLVTNYLKQGTAAARPAFPTAATDTLSLYFASDTETLSFYDWNDAAWQDIPSSGGLAAATTTEVLTGTSTTVAATPDALAALWEQGADIASAGTVSVGEGGYFHITGTTTITDIDFGTTKAGRAVRLVFDGILTLTHNGTTLILPTGANITTAAGDTCMVVSEGGDNVRVVSYQRKDGTALVGGSGSALTLITETVTSGSAADVTFSSIPATYRDLEIRVRGRGDNATTEVSVRLQFNGDTGSNYHSLLGVETSTIYSGAAAMSGTSIVRVFDIPAANATANYAGVGHIVIGDYRGTTFAKQVDASASWSRGTATTDILLERGAGTWTSTAAINAVKVFLAAGNFVDNSVVSLYGRM